MNRHPKLSRSHPLTLRRYGPDYFDWLVPALWGLSFSGYSVFLMLLVGSGVGAGLGTTSFSMGYRILTLIMALAIAYTSLTRLKLNLPSGFILSLSAFVLMYSLRVFYEGYVTGSVSAFEYIAKVHGAAFLPMLAFLYPMNRRCSKRCFWSLVAIGFVAVLIMMVLYRDYLGGSYRSIRYQSGVDESTVITPHKISYTGALVASLCVWALVAFWDRFSFRYKSMLFIFLIPSLVMLFFGGSRGALLAFTASVACYFFAQGKIKASQIVSLFFLVVALYVAGGLLSSQEGGGSMVVRVTSLVDELEHGEEAGAGRTWLWASATKQFLGSPLVGSGIVEKYSNFYPHNHIVEAFMATGVMGGGAFIALCYFGLFSAYKLLKFGGGYGWIGIIFIFYFVAGLFSGAIYDYEFWFSLCANVSLASTLERGKLT